MWSSTSVLMWDMPLIWFLRLSASSLRFSLRAISFSTWSSHLFKLSRFSPAWRNFSWTACCYDKKRKLISHLDILSKIMQFVHVISLSKIIISFWHNIIFEFDLKKHKQSNEFKRGPFRKKVDEISRYGWTGVNFRT